MIERHRAEPTNVIGPRLGAFVIDMLLAVAATGSVIALTRSDSVANAPVNGCARWRATTQFSGSCWQIGHRLITWEGGRLPFAFLVGAIVMFVNLVLLQGLIGATLGKLIMGVRVVDAQGETGGLGQALVRTMLLAVDLLGFGAVGLIAVRQRSHPHQRVGDRVAATYVVAADSVDRPIAEEDMIIELRSLVDELDALELQRAGPGLRELHPVGAALAEVQVVRVVDEQLTG